MYLKKRIFSLAIFFNLSFCILENSHALDITNIGANGMLSGQIGGNSSADAGFTIPNSDATNTAIAIGGNGGLSGNGGNSSAAAATIHSGLVSAIASATGGNGTRGEIGLRGDIGNFSGGNGGSAIAHANGISTDGGNVNVQVFQTGGSGGDSGSQFDFGGDGASSTLNNAATGSTTGLLSLTQFAKGGNAGFMGDFATRIGFAGSASSILNVLDNHASRIELKNTAQGGSGANSSDGGSAISNSNSTSTNDSSITISDSAIGGNVGFSSVGFSAAGSGSSNAFAINTGNQTINVSSFARGGDIGNCIAPCFGGSATSNAIARNNGDQTVTASSTSIGGAGVDDFIFNINFNDIAAGDANSNASATSEKGHASASASSTGGISEISGSAKAEAFSQGGAGSEATSFAQKSSFNLTAKSSVDNRTSGISHTFAAIDQPFPTYANQDYKTTTSFGTLLPKADIAQSALEDQTLIMQNFDFNGSSTPILLAELSVFNTSALPGLHIYKSSLELSFDTTIIRNSQDLLVGFLTPILGSTNFGANDKLNFSYGIDGILNQSFTLDANNVDSAYDFFNGRTLNLGQLTDLTDSNSVLKLVFNLELETYTAETGLDLGLIVGNSTFVISSNSPLSSVPLPASFWLLATGLLGLPGFARRKH